MCIRDRFVDRRLSVRISAVDKKTKKRLEVLRGKLEKQQALLKAAKAQTDEPGEVEKIEAGMEAIKSEIAELKK